MKVNLRSIYLGNKNELLVMPLQTNLIFIGQCTEMHFASFLSGGFTNMAVIKSTGKETGKTHLFALCLSSDINRRIQNFNRSPFFFEIT